MEVSANWKKYIEVTENTLGKIILCAVIAHVFYVLIQVHLRQVAKAEPAGVSGRKRGKRGQKKQKCSEAAQPNLGKGPSNTQQQARLTKVVALDCEMVGIQDGDESMLARVSIVNSSGQTLYDTFVKPTEPVVDYRTSVSGVRQSDLENGLDFHLVQNTVAKMIQGRILVGHALKNDMRVLYLSHPRKKMRDTSKFKPFREISHGRTPSLKKLAREILGVSLQSGEHSSVEDARAAMQLYNLHKRQWESGQRDLR